MCAQRQHEETTCGIPAIIGTNEPLDRRLCVPIFRLVCLLH